MSNALTNPDGTLKRPPSAFRSVIEKGGTYEPEKDRYHLYVSYACPWATRTLITRKLKGLEDIIFITVVSPRMDTNGWPFGSANEFPGAEADPLYDSKYVRDLYLLSNPEYTGRFTVPVLWDKKTRKVVNNESAEIVRILNTAFNEFLPPEKAKVDVYPENLRAEIDALHEWIYPNINNGVYRAGFAGSQEAYEGAVNDVFSSLDRLEKILTGKNYVVGDRLTEVDIRLWVTMVRFDIVYHGHFKCNIRNIRYGYPAINAWMKNLYWTNTAFKESTNFEHIKTHYYWSHTPVGRDGIHNPFKRWLTYSRKINPNRIVPVGPQPHIEPL
ncbi:S-glutathionyl-(chloro)hydroquinone reductase [Marasmius crinis-equi]|uniref:S-glutathionyl-(Chloro)hydroquinone reductase n=1 Tax=Marasmius crinis-equi TaxID=585013 RepID=A0ABR3EM51_9AGAR